MRAFIAIFCLSNLSLQAAPPVILKSVMESNSFIMGPPNFWPTQVLSIPFSNAVNAVVNPNAITNVGQFVKQGTGVTFTTNGSVVTIDATNAGGFVTPFNTNQFSLSLGMTNIKSGALFTNLIERDTTNFFQGTNRTPWWQTNSTPGRYEYIDRNGNRIFLIRDDSHPNKGMYILDETAYDFSSIRLRGHADTNVSNPGDPRATFQFGLNDFKEFAFKEFQLTYKIAEGGNEYKHFWWNLAGDSVTNGDALVMQTFEGAKIRINTNIWISGNTTNASGGVFLDNSRKFWIKDSGGTYRNGITIDGGDDLHIGDAALGAVIIDAPVLQLAGPAALNLLRTDASRNVEAVTIGPGVNFDGTTLSVTPWPTNVNAGGFSITNLNILSQSGNYTNTAGQLFIANDKYIFMRESGGTYRGVLKVDSGDDVRLGNSSLGTVIVDSAALVASGIRVFNSGGGSTASGFQVASNAISAWPTAPGQPGSFALVNSNGFPYILLSTNGAGIGADVWTGTNKFGW